MVCNYFYNSFRKTFYYDPTCFLFDTDETPQKTWSEITNDKEKKKEINVQHETVVKVFAKPVFYLT